MSKYVEGGEIIVKVGGREFATVIISGVQRFKTNTAIEAFIDASSTAFDVWCCSDRSTPEPYNLNTLAVECAEGKHTQDDMLTLYTSFGYSVSGFADLSIFDNLDIRNPLWEEDHYEKLSSSAFKELMELISEPFRYNGDDAVRFVADTVRDGKWNAHDGVLSNGTDTIDRVILGYLENKSIEPWDIKTKESTSEELKDFLKHLTS